MFLNIKLESVLISLDYKVTMATMQGGTYHSPTVREEGKRNRARLRFRNQLTSPGTKHWFCSLVVKSICAQCKVSAGVYLQPPSQGPQPLLWYFGTLYTIQLGNLTSSHPICCQHWGSWHSFTHVYENHPHHINTYLSNILDFFLQQELLLRHKYFFINWPAALNNTCPRWNADPSR